MASKFVNLTDTLDQWRVKANAVYGIVGDLTTLNKNAAVTYTGIVGENEDTFTGSHATFSVTRSSGSYEASIADGGNGYDVGDTIVVRGTELGGETPEHDATITVTSVDPGFSIDGISISGTAQADIISEVNKLRQEMGDAFTELDTNNDDVRAAINEIASVLKTAEEEVASYELNTDASNLVAAINEIETAVRGVLNNYDLNTTSNDIVNAINEHEADLGHVEDFAVQGTSPIADANHNITYVDLGSDVVSALNALKVKSDWIADELGGTMASDYDGPDTNIIDALDTLYNRSDLGTLDAVYVRRNGADPMTGMLQLSQYGITSNDNNLLLKTGSSDTTALTISATNQNVGIGGVPGTHKVKVTGSLNATNGLYYNGDNTDNRYVRIDTGSDQVVEVNTSFAGTTSLVPATGQELVIAGSVVANDSYNFLEWSQDMVGAMFTDNIEERGISATYDDSTGKVGLAIAHNSHNHVSTNITDWTEAVQDTVGGMVSGNTENGLSVTYNDTTGKLNFDVNDPTVTLSGHVTGSATMTNLGSININTTLTTEAVQDAIGGMVSGNTETGISVTYDDSNNEFDFALTADPIINLTGDASGSVTLTNLASTTFDLNVTVLDDSHNHVIGNIDNFTEEVQDIVGGMFAPTNIESGINVYYNDLTGKINSDVNDFTLTFNGDVSGSGTITNLGSKTITLTITDDSHNHTTSNIDGFTEAVQDAVGAMVSGNTESGISVTYDDSANEYDFVVAASTSNINDGAVTNAKLGADAVTGSKIADNSISIEHLTNDCVSSAELKSVVGLTIYNSAGTALKTLYGAGS